MCLHDISMKAVYGIYNEWNASGFMVITSKLGEQDLNLLMEFLYE